MFLISFLIKLLINHVATFIIKMAPIFKCLICRKDIERSTKTFWKKKGHLLCSTCLDSIDKNYLSNENISKKQKIKKPLI